MDTNGEATAFGRVELLHATPGRVRLRATEIRGNPVLAREVEQQIAGLKLARRVEVSPVTGSILVTYDPEDTSSLAELSRLFLPGVNPATLTVLPEPSPDGDAVTSSVVQGVLSNLRAINANVRSTTGGLDLRVLVPAILVMMGIKTLVTDRKRTPAWYNYFWFAFGTFCTLNRRATSGAEAPVATAELPAETPAVVAALAAGDNGA